MTASDRILVLGHGSVNGVDALRFRPDTVARERVRSQAGVPPQSVVFLYLGRFSKDKGLLDLARAFARTAREVPGAWLMLVGPDEDGIAQEIRTSCGGAAERLCILGHTSEPEQFMAAADVFVLPSYREGFGSVILEAAAAAVPRAHFSRRLTGSLPPLPPKCSPIALHSAIFSLPRVWSVPTGSGCSATARSTA